MVSSTHLAYLHDVVHYVFAEGMVEKNHFMQLTCNCRIEKMNLAIILHIKFLHPI